MDEIPVHLNWELAETLDADQLGVATLTETGEHFELTSARVRVDVAPADLQLFANWLATLRQRLETGDPWASGGFPTPDVPGQWQVTCTVPPAVADDRFKPGDAAVVNFDS